MPSPSSNDLFRCAVDRTRRNNSACSSLVPRPHLYDKIQVQPQISKTTQKPRVRFDDGPLNVSESILYCSRSSPPHLANSIIRFISQRFHRKLCAEAYNLTDVRCNVHAYPLNRSRNKIFLLLKKNIYKRDNNIIKKSLLPWSLVARVRTGQAENIDHEIQKSRLRGARRINYDVQ